jgi:hypothetical protein
VELIESVGKQAVTLQTRFVQVVISTFVRLSEADSTQQPVLTLLRLQDSAMICARQSSIDFLFHRGEHPGYSDPSGQVREDMHSQDSDNYKHLK